MRNENSRCSTIPNCKEKLLLESLFEAFWDNIL